MIFWNGLKRLGEATPPSIESGTEMSSARMITSPVPSKLLRHCWDLH